MVKSHVAAGVLKQCHGLCHGGARGVQIVCLLWLLTKPYKWPLLSLPEPVGEIKQYRGFSFTLFSNPPPNNNNNTWLQWREGGATYLMVSHVSRIKQYQGKRQTMTLHHQFFLLLPYIVRSYKRVFCTPLAIPLITWLKIFFHLFHLLV